MDRSPPTVAVALALSLLLVAAGVAVTGAAGQATGADGRAVAPAEGPATVGPESDAGTERRPITGCFAGTGYPIAIGDGGGGTAMDAVVHLSVLTDPGAGNEFGVETAGRLDGEPVVTLAAGVRLTAKEAVADGLDPFAAFEVLYTYELRLPMFDGAIGDAGYEDDGSPIGSGAGAVDC